MTTRTGGPAFPATIYPHPQELNQNPVQHQGISLRQHYALHAPAMPDWFRVEWNIAPPLLPPVPDNWGGPWRDDFLRLKSGEVAEFSVEPQVMAFYIAWKIAHEAHNAWRNGQRERKFFMWRWHFADMMIKTGSQP